MCGIVKKLKKIQNTITKLNKKRGWYFLLVIASSIYVIYYRKEIYEIDQFNARSLVFIIWLILLFLPLLSEIEIGNIKIKKEVEEAKSELKNNINDLRMQIINMQVSNTNSNTIMLGALPSESELTDMKKSVQSSGQDGYYEESVQEEKVPDETIYLLSVRRILERELTLICNGIDTTERKSVGQMIYLAVKNELIDMNTADILRQINGIANRSIHGEIVSDEYIDFVKEVFPEMKIRLKKVKNRVIENNRITCTRCHYSGPSKYENVCPRCGFVTDDD